MRFRRLLAEAHLRIGSTLKLRGENKAAEESFQRGTDLLGPLVVQGKSPLATKDLAGAHHLLAALRRDENRIAEALEHEEKSRALYETLVARYPAVTTYRRALAVSYYHLTTLH